MSTLSASRRLFPSASLALARRRTTRRRPMRMPLTTRRRAAYSHSRLPSVPWRVSVVLSLCQPARVAAHSPRRHAPRDRCAWLDSASASVSSYRVRFDSAFRAGLHPEPGGGARRGRGGGGQGVGSQLLKRRRSERRWSRRQRTGRWWGRQRQGGRMLSIPIRLCSAVCLPSNGDARTRSRSSIVRMRQP